ncbi:MAG: hypothetical protein JSV09_15130 [Thermoplasmata archaeon]|nr:MAG: hypothetical protein JSV09_15130 [Thermoplasmata archaeon]
MKKWVLLSLIVVFFVAIFIRLFPLTQYEIWGSDTGEYFQITSQLSSDGYVSTDYDGWGFGYPYFPGIYYLSASVHFLSGMDILYSLIIMIPLFAAFSVLVVFFMAKVLFKSNGVGLLASAFLAVAMPHVFATSHPMPGSLGDVLFLFSILLLILSYKNDKFIPLLILSAMALTITHHLSSYFLFISVFGGLFLKEMLRHEDKKDTRLYWAFLIFFLTILILYWTIIATPFSDRVVSSAFDIPSWVVFCTGYIAILLAYILVKLRRRINWTYEPRYPKPSVQFGKYLAWIFVLFLVLVIVTVASIPGTDIRLDPVILLLFSPFIILASLGSVGPGYSRFYENGMTIYGWILAIFLSIFLAIATANHVLLPYRHPQYMMAPLALLMAIGVVKIFKAMSDDKGLKKRLVVGLLIVLLGLTALSSYPPKEVMGGFQEGTGKADMQAVFWAREYLTKGATVATDHRMSSMLFGFANLNSTWDEADKTLHASSYNESKDEIHNIKIPSGEKSIDYVLLDDDIKEGAALLQWENAEPMSTEAQEKFDKWPFVKLYEANDVEIYGLVGE